MFLVHFKVGLFRGLVLFFCGGMRLAEWKRIVTISLRGVVEGSTNSKEATQRSGLDGNSKGAQNAILQPESVRFIELDIELDSGSAATTGCSSGETQMKDFIQMLNRRVT